MTVIVWAYTSSDKRHRRAHALRDLGGLRLHAPCGNTWAKSVEPRLAQPGDQVCINCQRADESLPLVVPVTFSTDLAYVERFDDEPALFTPDGTRCYDCDAHLGTWLTEDDDGIERATFRPFYYLEATPCRNSLHHADCPGHPVFLCEGCATCEWQTHPATREDQASYCENERVWPSQYCAQHTRAMEQLKELADEQGARVITLRGLS